MGGYQVPLFITDVADRMGHIMGCGQGAGKAPADDIGGVHDEKESRGVYVFNEMADPGNLGKVHNGKDDFLFHP